jgi:UDP-N-acetylmuramate dehydrogenase
MIVRQNTLVVERNVPLQGNNTFGIVAKAHQLVRIASAQDAQQVAASAELAPLAKNVLGGGSNIVLTGDVRPLVLKVEIMGRQVLEDNPRHTVLEIGAGENWHELVTWSLDQNLPGLENLALIPGTVGASPVQNIGAYGIELQDRFESLDAVDLLTGDALRLSAAQCAFRYRDSVFKHRAPGGIPAGAACAVASPRGMGLADRALITHVRLRLPKPWRPVLGYLDIQRRMLDTGVQAPSARQLFDWVCAIRQAKLPDPQKIGNAGSFFKNPTVSAEQCEDIIAREPRIVHYKLDDGTVKLAAAWLIDACGWKGKSVGNAGVHERQALVLVNRGGKTDPVTGGEVMTLAKAIQTSVYERFGIMLEPEPVVW